MRVYRIDIMTNETPPKTYRFYQGIGLLFNNPVGIRMDMNARTVQGSIAIDKDFTVVLYNIDKYWYGQGSKFKNMCGASIRVWGGVAETPLTKRAGINTSKSDNILLGAPLVQGVIHNIVPEVNGRDWILHLLCISSGGGASQIFKRVEFFVKQGENYKNKALSAWRIFSDDGEALSPSQYKFKKKTQIAPTNMGSVSEPLQSLDELKAILAKVDDEIIPEARLLPKVHMIGEGDMVDQPNMGEFWGKETNSNVTTTFSLVLSSKYKVNDIIYIGSRFFMNFKGLLRFFGSGTQEGSMFDIASKSAGIDQELAKKQGIFSLITGTGWQVIQTEHIMQSRVADPQQWCTKVSANLKPLEEIKALLDKIKQQNAPAPVVEVQNKVAEETKKELLGVKDNKKNIIPEAQYQALGRGHADK